jgi:hypothetical protein
MLFFKRVVDEHPLVFAYDKAVSALNKAWDRFNGCSPDEVETAVLELKVAEGDVERVIRAAKEAGVKSTTLRSKLTGHVRPPFWLKYIVFRNPDRRRVA